MLLRVSNGQEFLRLCRMWQPPFVAVEPVEGGYAYTAGAVLPGHAVFFFVVADSNLVEHLRGSGIEVVHGRIVGDTEVITLDQVIPQPVQTVPEKRESSCRISPLQEAVKKLEQEAEKLLKLEKDA